MEMMVSTNVINDINSALLILYKAFKNLIHGMAFLNDHLYNVFIAYSI